MKNITLLFGALILLSTVAFSQSDESNQQNIKMKPALLVIDVQKQYIPYMSKEDQELAIQMMNWAIWIFRENNLPVIRIYHTDPEWGPEPGSSAFEFHDSLKVKETDPKIVKNYPSAFTKTELDKLLQEKKHQYSFSLRLKLSWLCIGNLYGCYLT